jgi:hypothetical protein
MKPVAGSEIMTMLKKAVGVAVLGLIAVGCGKGMSGTFSVTQSNLSSCSSPQINLNITDEGGSVRGTGSNSCIASETLTGTNDGNGHVTNAVLTVTLASSQNQYGYNSGYNSGYNPGYYGNNNYGNQPSVTCTYTGTLNLSNNVLSGTLNIQQNAQSSYYYNSSCPSTFTLNGVMNG